MSNDNGSKTQSKRKYVSCPNCSTILLQGELVKNTIVKCSNCNHLIFVEVENGRTVAKEQMQDKE